MKVACEACKEEYVFSRKDAPSSETFFMSEGAGAGDTYYPKCPRCGYQQAVFVKRTPKKGSQ